MRDGRNTQGFMLVAVLGVLTLLSALTAGATLVVRSAIDGIKLGDEDIALSGLVQAGIALTAYRLFVLHHPAEWVDGQALPIGTLPVLPAVSDESGLIDLNGASPALLASAYAASGAFAMAPDAFAARVVDWRDADDVRSPDGAEAADYAAAELPQRPVNRPFHSVNELAELLGLGADDLAALKPFLTVFNPDGKVNVMSARPAVIAALPGIRPPTVEEILARRLSPSTDTIAALRSALASQSECVKFEPGPAYRVQIKVRGRSGRSEIASVVIAAATEAGTPYHVLDWAE